jgi:tRNA(His) 5'-end guanylyltransferase
MHMNQYHGTITDILYKKDKFNKSEDIDILEKIFYIFISFFSFYIFLMFFHFLNKIANKYREEQEELERENQIPEDLGDRMKYYEEISRKLDLIPQYKPFIVRLDGRAFSNFTRKLKKDSKENNNLPYSKDFKRAMLFTANDIMREFKCASAYTHSDEITLIFNNPNPESQYIFDGKVFKLLSLIPSFASVSFMEHIYQETNYDSKKKSINSINSNICDHLNNSFNSEIKPTFDARIIVFPENKDYEIVNHMIWRSKCDCTRNFISLYAETFIGKKAIQNMSNLERIEILKERGYDLNSDEIDYSLKHGTFLKYNSENDEVEFYVFRNIQYSDDFYKFLTSKQNYYLSQDQMIYFKALSYNHNNYELLFNL